MLILLHFPAPLALVQLDEALPCLRVGGLEFGGSQIYALGLVELVLLVQREGEEDVSGGSAQHPTSGILLKPIGYTYA
jgi:hypothetical protein